MLFRRRTEKSVAKRSQEDRHSNQLHAGAVTARERVRRLYAENGISYGVLASRTDP
jgi:hypothetical protein